MPKNAHSTSRLAWLAAALGQKRSRIMELMQRMAHFGLANALKPSLLGRFQYLLDQLNEERSEELEILKRIESIEQKHLWRRKNNLLAHANSNLKPAERAPAPILITHTMWDKLVAFCGLEK